MTSYRACGLVIDSEITIAECPLAADENAAPDVTLRVGPIDPAWGVPTQVPYVRRMPDGSLLCGEEGGPWFLISRSTVVVDDTRADWRRFFVGPVLGALCYLNDQLPLHASSVAVGGRAVVFAGPSGAGKSTLAAALVHRYGCRLISDEVTAVRMTPAGPVVSPYLHYHRLSDASTACLDLDAGRLAATVRDDDKTLVTARDVASDTTRCDAVYLLQPASGAASPDSVSGLPQVAAAAQVMDNLYRPDIGEICRSSSALLAAAATLVEQVGVHVLSYDAGTPGLRGLAESVLADLDTRSLATTGRAPRAAD